MSLFSDAQLHLALTHLPVVGALLAAATLVVAAVARSRPARGFGLALLVFAGVAVVPTYLTGEGAEEVVEDRPGVSEALIERHEEAAGAALALTLAAGGIAAAALIAGRLGRERLAAGLFVVALGASVADAATLGWVAHLGGQIRHDEIRLAARGRAPDATPRLHGAVGDD